MGFWKLGKGKKGDKETAASRATADVDGLPQGHRIDIDRSTQKLWLDTPEDSWRAEELHARLSDLHVGEFRSAAMLIQKAKQFDDGLYAAVELAAMNGCGDAVAKRAWLGELRELLGTQAAAVPFYSAEQLADEAAAVPDELSAQVQRDVAEFRADATKSKPISFYTWNSELRDVFCHDRMLQQPLLPDDVRPVAAAIATSAKLRAAYEGYLGLIERLTNPLTEDRLRTAIAQVEAGDYQPTPGNTAPFPPSISHEQQLILKMFGDAEIPDGFELMTELIARVRRGDVDLKPRPDSGWYDHQIWSLQPLLDCESTAEAARFGVSDDYKKHLEDLFKGTMALARETHAKQLDVAVAGAAMPFDAGPTRPKITIRPELSTEPLPTHYQRRADAYRFVRQVLESYFGEGALASMQRQTAAGPVDLSLDAELSQVTALFDDAAASACVDLGMTEPGASPGPFGAWDTQADVDLHQDIRMMVPVFYDLGRRKTKAWVVLGWASRRLTTRFSGLPGVRVFDRKGNDVTDGFDIDYASNNFQVAYPVFAEVYVDRILDRDEFRGLCDDKQTREAILEAL